LTALAAQPMQLSGSLKGVRRGWLLLAIVTVVLGAAGCGTSHRALPVGGGAHRSSSSALAATARASGSARPSATERAGHSGGPALAGSFLMDLTWVSDQRGWVLAALPCSRGLCPRVAATGDGGRTWVPLPVPPGVIQNGAVNCARVGCISQLRFATTRVGYLFGPALYQTGDGGRTWRRVPSRPVEALEPSAGAVIRVVYDHGGCPGPCTRTVQETTAGSATWRTLLRIPFASAAGGVTAQVIWPGSPVIYVPVYGNLAAGYGQAVIFRSTDGGSSWQRLSDPCFGAGQPVHDAAALAAAPGGYLAVLCLSRTGTGSTFVRTSTDYGSSWSPPRTVPGGTRNHLNLVAAASPGRLVAATGGVSGSGPFTYRLAVSTDGGRRWSTAVTGTTQLMPQAPGTAFLGFEDPTTGRWISDARHIWTTHDGGLHWLQRAFP
jgi:photosystem II stability/assembly factor-like uncharacterized protein